MPKSLLDYLWPPDVLARIAIVAAGISVASAAGTIWSVWYARSQALSAAETLRRSDESLTILVDVNREAPVTVFIDNPSDYSSFEIRFSANAAIINGGGSAAVVTDGLWRHTTLAGGT
jgi:hypothetical protein